MNMSRTVEDAAKTLATAFKSISEGIDQQLDGSLERHVEDAAGACWELRERSVQVKSGLFRSKTLVVQDPIFKDDNEKQLQRALTDWENAAEEVVAASALEIKVATDRLVYLTNSLLSTSLNKKVSDQELLQIFDALLSTDHTIASSTAAAYLPSTWEVVQALALKTGTIYLKQTQSGGPQLALTIAAHPKASTWASRLVQLTPSELLTMLPVLSASDPAALQCLLGQCNLNEIKQHDCQEFARQLLIAAPTPKSGSEVELWRTILTTIVNLGQKYESMREVVLDYILKLLLSAATGSPAHTLVERINNNGTATESQTIASIDLTTLASWAFGPINEQSSNGRLAVETLMTTMLPWMSWLKRENCSSGVKLRWLVSFVAIAKSLKPGRDNESIEALWSLLESVLPSLTLTGLVDGNDEAYLLCMLEAPGGNDHVTLLWQYLQAGLGLSLCSSFIQSNNEDSAMKVADFLAGADLSTKLEHLCVAQQSSLCVELISSTVDTCGCLLLSPRFLPLVSVLSRSIGTALTQQDNRTIGKLSGSIASAISHALTTISNQDTLAGNTSTTNTTTERLVMDLLSELEPQQQTTQQGSNITNRDDTGSFDAVYTWLAILSAQTLNPADIPPIIWQLLSNVTKSAYYTTAFNHGKNVEKFVMALVAVVWMHSVEQIQRAAQRMMHNEDSPWLCALAAWLEDACMVSELVQNSNSSVDGDGQQVAALIKTALEQWASSTTEAQDANTNAEWIVEEAFQLIETINKASTNDHYAAVALSFIFISRLERHLGILQPLMSADDIAARFNSLSQLYQSKATTETESSGSQIVASALQKLAMHVPVVLQPQSSASAVAYTNTFVGDLSVVAKLGKLDPSWKAWSTEAAAVYNRDKASQQQDVLLPASIAVDESTSSSSKGSLEEKENVAVEEKDFQLVDILYEDLKNSVDEAAGVLRAWARKGEKQAIREVNLTASPSDFTREGDVPSTLSEAQRILWELSHRLHEDLYSIDTRLRELVCQRYKPLTPAEIDALGETTSSESSGTRVVPPHKDPKHGEKCLTLRRQALHAATDTIQAKELMSASKLLFCIEHALLPLTPPEDDSLPKQLLLAVASALVDGSSPAVAVKYLVCLFERAVAAGVTLDEHNRLRLVPQISRALTANSTSTTASGVDQGAAGGGRKTLKEQDAAVLLKAAIDPDAMLEHRQLKEFYTAMKLVLRVCRDLSISSATTLLAGFDAMRFSSLVLEKSDGGSGSSKKDDVGIDTVLSLALHCASIPGVENTGAAMVEGVLGMAPGKYYGACLATALAAPNDGGARQSLMRMLGSVPVDMLSDAVIGEALLQLQEAYTSDTLSPPTMHYPVLSLLYRSPPVVQSLQQSLQYSRNGGSGKSTAASRRTSDLGWTARVITSSRTDVHNATPTAAAGSSSGNNNSTVGDGNNISSSDQVDTNKSDKVGEFKSPDSQDLVQIVPVPALSTDLATLFEQTLDSLLKCLLRNLGSGYHGEALAEQAQQAFTMLFDIVSEAQPWVMEWLWKVAYQRHVHAFLTVSGPASGNAATVGFRQYWGSLPWSSLATFNQSSPEILESIRAYLPNPDRAAAELLHSMDWSIALVNALPTDSENKLSMASVDGVFSIIDEDAEDEDDVNIVATGATSSTMTEGKSAHNESPSSKPENRGLWAANLALLATQAGVLFPAEDLPPWIQELLWFDIDHAGLSRLLSAADWSVIENKVVVVVAENHNSTSNGSIHTAPWLLHPVLRAPTMVSGNVGSRLLRIAELWSRGAVKAGTARAAYVACSALQDLMLLSVCQGVKLQQQAHSSSVAGGITNNSSTMNDSSVPLDTSTGVRGGQSEMTMQQPPVSMLQLPDDFPAELLEGTIEGQQLQQQQSAAAAAALSATEQLQQEGDHLLNTVSNPETSGILVEISSCFRLTAEQHAELLQKALIPLAQHHASFDVARTMDSALLQSSSLLGGGDLKAEVDVEAELREWVDLPIEAWVIGPDNNSNKVTQQQQRDGNYKISVVSTVLRCLLQAPVTIMISEPLACGNAAVPWDETSAVFVSTNSGTRESNISARRPSPRGSAIRQRVSSLLHRTGTAGGARGSSVEATTSGNRYDHVNDLAGLRDAIMTVLEEACTSKSTTLAACVMKIILISPALNGCPVATLFFDDLLHSMAATAQLPTSSYSSIITGINTNQPSQEEEGEQQPAVVVALENASSTVNTTTGASGLAASSRPGGSSSSTSYNQQQHPVKVPENLQRAVAAATHKLSEECLVQVMENAALLGRPLLSAFAAERLRLQTTVLDKNAWQAYVVKVLNSASKAEARSDRPLELAAVWLQALAWVGDSRWRRLPQGVHTEALMAFIDALELRVQLLHVLTPEDLAYTQGGGGFVDQGTSTSSSSMASKKKKVLGALKGFAGGLQPGRKTGEAAAAAGFITDGGSSQQQQNAGVGSSSSEHYIDSIADVNTFGIADAAAGGVSTTAPPQTIPEGVEYPLLDSTSQPPTEDKKLGKRFGQSLKNLVRRDNKDGDDTDDVGGEKKSSLVGDFTSKLSFGGGGKKVPNSPLVLPQSSVITSQQPGATPTRTTTTATTKSPLRQAQQARQNMDHEQEALVRIGLMAFLVNAYIRSVLTPAITRRTASAGSDNLPPSPTHRTSSLLLHPQHSRGGSSLMGSRGDDQMMLEMDSLMQARGELDALVELAQSPLFLWADPGGVLKSLTGGAAAELLAAGTTIEVFQAASARLVLSHQEGDVILVVIKAAG